MTSFDKKRIPIRVKGELNNISPSFCLAKWKQVTLHLHNGRTHSCHHPYPHKIPLDELKDNPSALHNTSFKKEQRRMMLNGERPKECQYCWNIEDLDGFKNNDFFSDRVIKSADKWALPHLYKVSKMPWDANVNPSYLEVSFSNLCNFKCSYCSPVYSSRWTEEIESHGPYDTFTKFNDLTWFKQQGEMPIHHKEYNPYVEAFWKWWPEMVDSLSVFRITGGEPLLQQDLYKLLDFLDENPKPKLDLAINTNGCVPDKLFNEFKEKVNKILVEKKINSILIYTSLDGFGQYAEYSRHGLNFEQWVTNAERLLSELPRITLSVMCTTNIFSIPEFQKFLELMLYLKKKYPRRLVVVDTNILRHPQHLNLGILTDEYKGSLDNCLEFMKENMAIFEQDSQIPGFYDFELDRLERLIQYMKSGPNPDENITVEHARADFYRFVNQHDERRGTNFLETFPMLDNFYAECEKEYNKIFKHD